jgi:outer membrane receptor protein involved in Fe transport
MPSLARPLRPGLALLALFVPAPAWSQDPAPPDPTHTDQQPGVPGVGQLSLGQLLDPGITTASRILERATEAPATVYVITSADIRARGYSTLVDVLRDLPGMEVVEQYYSEQGTLVPVRGVVGNNKIVLLVNGMRVNPPGGEELMIRGDVSVRFADQIEVIYGPGSTLYGQDAISAVINIKTRSPGDVTVEALGGYGLDDTKEWYASFNRTFFKLSDLPISVTGFVAGRDSDLTDFRKDTRSGGRSTTTIWAPSAARDPPPGGTSASTPSPGWSPSTPRCRPGTGRASAAARRAAARAGRCRCCSSCPRRAGATGRCWWRGSTRCRSRRRSPCTRS